MLPAAGAVTGNRELAHRTGLPKPAVARLTHTLVTMGYWSSCRIEWDPPRYRWDMQQLRRRQSRSWRSRSCSELLMRSFALGVRDRLSVMSLIHCQSKLIFTLRMAVGRPACRVSRREGHTQRRRSSIAPE
ncbi:helix-turn-helix domain-containing protein [Mesorhizobium montanum]|uniref:helix-turn-helix domain-containing protein n=1 Tax=Mesorhizobium montanum TaxID=3072323 RepID=UPI003D31E3DC